MPIYFIQCERTCHVKIGIATDVTARLHGLQTASSSRLRLLGFIPGNKSDERELHERFADLRVHGEWFRFEGELVEHLIALAEGRPPRDRSEVPLTNFIHRHHRQRAA